MAAPEPLCLLIGVNPKHLTKKERILLEAELFSIICNEIKDHYRNRYKKYYYLLKLPKEKENEMLDANFAYSLIEDILSTQQYNIAGIAHYTNTFEDFIKEIIEHRNTNPSALFLRQLIELHRVVRRDLYVEISKKIAGLIQCQN